MADERSLWDDPNDLVDPEDVDANEDAPQRATPPPQGRRIVTPDDYPD